MYNVSPQMPKAQAYKTGFNLIIVHLYLKKSVYNTMQEITTTGITMQSLKTIGQF